MSFVCQFSSCGILAEALPTAPTSGMVTDLRMRTIIRYDGCPHRMFWTAETIPRRIHRRSSAPLDSVHMARVLISNIVWLVGSCSRSHDRWSTPKYLVPVNPLVEAFNLSKGRAPVSAID